MEKNIDVGGKLVPFKATGATPRIYRRLFDRDIFADMSSLTNAIQAGGTLGTVSLELFENIAYCMAKQADASIPDEPDAWLDSFDVLSIYQILPQIFELWNLNQFQLETPKKNNEEQSAS